MIPLIVDVCHAWDKARPKPEGYLIFNQDCSHVLLVHADTAGKWLRKERFDKAKKRTRAFYECPVSLCKFYSI